MVATKRMDPRNSKHVSGSSKGFPSKRKPSATTQDKSSTSRLSTLQLTGGRMSSVLEGTKAFRSPSPKGSFRLGPHPLINCIS